MAAQPHDSDTDDADDLPEYAPAENPSDRALREARRYRAQLLKRLDDEEADDLADKLRGCGEPFTLICTDCGERHTVEKRCRKKWCPVCARGISARRVAKYEHGVAKMQWPLHVTLTVRNPESIDTDFMRKLREDFGRLRRRVIWSKNVAGGVAGMEVTRKRQTWHPHLHSLVDCEWLATKTPKPERGASAAEVRDLCKRAQREMCRLWGEVVGQKSAHVWIRRIKGHRQPEILRKECAEVLKYAAKGSELAKCKGEVAPVIRMLDGCRLTTSFGSLYGQLRGAEPPKNPMQCEGCGISGLLIPAEMVDRMIRIHRSTFRR